MLDLVSNLDRIDAPSDCRKDCDRSSIGGALQVKKVVVLAVCAALCAMGCEPKLVLQLERHGETYEFDLRRADDRRGFGAESFGVQEGSRVICEIRHAPGPSPKISRWTYGSRPDWYSISPHCEPLQAGRTYRATGGGRFFGMLVFRLKASGDVEVLER
jgi:hypothetical protein